MATDVHINDIVLRNVQTLEWSTTPQRDPSDTDQWYHHHRIRVRSIVCPALLAIQNPNLGVHGTGSAGDAVGSLYAALVCKFGEDRKEFIYKMSGQEIIKSNTLIDANNGPKFSELKVVHHTPRALRIEFAIDLALRCCNAPGISPSEITGPGAVVNNRWSCADDVDENFRTVRRWRGHLRVARIDANPQMFRGICVPALARGFKRRSMNFTSDPNGLELGYEVVDEEMLGDAPPEPATSMEGVYSENVGQDAISAIGDLRLKLEGPKGADKLKMIERAMQIAEVKLQLNTFSKTRQVISLSIADYIGQDTNAVEVNVRTRHSLEQSEQSSATSIGPIIMKQMGKPLELPDDYDRQVAVLKGPYGTATLSGLFQCYLQSPCDPTHAIPTSGTSSTGSPEPGGEDKGTDQPETEVTNSTGTVAGNFEPVPYSSDNDDGAYQFATVEVAVDRNDGRVPLPVARASTDNGPSHSMIRLHQPTSTMTLKISSERLNRWPALLREEDFTAGDIQFWNRKSHVVTQAPKLTADGRTQLFAIDATYHYVMSRALRPGESPPVSALPWDQFTAEQNKIPESVFMPPTAPKGIAL